MKNFWIYSVDIQYTTLVSESASLEIESSYLYNNQSGKNEKQPEVELPGKWEETLTDWLVQGWTKK